MSEKNKPAVGAEVALRIWGSWTFGYKVKSITPSGQVVVALTRADGTTHERRFSRDGREMRSRDVEFPSNRVRIDFDVEERRAETALWARQEEARTLLRLVRAEVPSHAGKEQLLERVSELERLLVAARAAVEAI